ncbi:signal peptidase I [Alkalicella caledoniensis]|uniref:Signal peptidase I n=1 Tax=Alkalicella caledoniensis TaxID=2731377 RepID=A0A7G9WCH6_ALKCA|nr:signal peptidase I [Alkalicella caledoniensis]QNO16388.1 signal peptidase I [Alkalicella caledoniensis]
MKELKEWIKSIVIAIILALIIRGFVMESFIVDGSSMLPTFTDNERVLVNKFVYRFREPRHGEIVVFPFPNEEDKILIKRVIGEPGDKVEIISEQLYLNDQLVDEGYILHDSAGKDFGPVWVPEGYVLLLGDNRNNSHDSRDPEVGFIDIDDIRGKTFMRYWPISKIRYFK